jgi:hypothetical protein
MQFSDYFLLDFVMYLFQDFLIELEHKKDDQAKLNEQLFHLKIHDE